MSLGLTTTNLNFEKTSEIGHEGKNSNVYIAHDKQLDADLVVKQIKKSSLSDPLEYFTEAKRLYDSEHPNVVQIKYACEDGDHIFLAMPYYKSGSLKGLINSRFLTVREIIRYATQFLSGVHNIHVKRLIHFDIKPDNILLSDTNEALISDFGISRNMNLKGVGDADRIYGKQAPPESFSQDQHTMLFDIYCCGITLYRLCNGDQVFYDQYNAFGGKRHDYIHAVKSGKFPDRKCYLPHIPKSLRKTIKKAIEVDPNDRYQTVLQLLNDLGSVSEFLDWKLTRADKRDTWLREDDERTIEVRVDYKTDIADVTTLKTMKASGKQSKVSAGCKEDVAINDLASVLPPIFTEHE